MDADEQIKRAKLAKAELNMVQEFLDLRRKELFEQFVGSVPSEDLHELHTQAAALTSLEDYLTSLVNSGKLATASKEYYQ